MITNLLIESHVLYDRHLYECSKWPPNNYAN